MRAPVIRMSLGFFDADNANIIEAKLAETRARLEPGVRALRGNLGYFAGIDRANNAMHNVSFWESVEGANQMASFQPMVALAPNSSRWECASRGRSSISKRYGASAARETLRPLVGPPARAIRRSTRQWRAPQFGLPRQLGRQD